MLEGLLRVITLGVVNVQDQGVIIKDPVTGLGNLLANARDAALRNERQGVWIGKRALNEGVGFSTYLLQHTKSNLVEYAFRIDGKQFHLQNNKITPLASRDTRKYEWFFKGPTKNNLTAVKKLVEQVNQMICKRQIKELNSSLICKAFVYYCQGIFAQKKVKLILAGNAEINLIGVETYNAGKTTIEFFQGN